MGLWAGVAAGDLGAPGASWRIALVILWGLSWAAAAWLLQDGFRSFLSWERRPGLLALASCIFLLATGLLAGCLGLALVCCLVQCLLGLLVLFGGRRSEEGAANPRGSPGPAAVPVHRGPEAAPPDSPAKPGILL